MRTREAIATEIVAGLSQAGSDTDLEGRPDPTDLDLSDIDFGPTTEELIAALQPKGRSRVTFVHAPISGAAAAPEEDAGDSTRFVDTDPTGLHSPPPDQQAASDEETTVIPRGEAVDTAGEAEGDDDLRCDDVEQSALGEKGARSSQAFPDIRTAVGDDLEPQRRGPSRKVALGAAAAVCVALAVVAFLTLRPGQVAYTIELIDRVSHEEIAEQITKSGTAGEELVVTAPDVDGYLLADGESEKRSIELDGAGVNTVVFHYDRVTSYTVRIVDRNGSELSDPLTVDNARVGEPVVEHAGDIDGYLLVSPETVEKELGDNSDSNVIEFVYARRTPYTVRYVDGSGQELRSETYDDHAVGDSVTIEAAPVEGYALASEPTQTIVLGEDGGANVVTFSFSPVVPSTASQVGVSQYQSPTPTNSAPASTPTPQDAGDIADVYLD